MGESNVYNLIDGCKHDLFNNQTLSRWKARRDDRSYECKFIYINDISVIFTSLLNFYETYIFAFEIFTYITNHLYSLR